MRIMLTTVAIETTAARRRAEVPGRAALENEHTMEKFRFYSETVHILPLVCLLLLSYETSCTITIGPS